MPSVHIQESDGFVPFQDSPRKQTQGNALINNKDMVKAVQSFGNSSLVGVLVAEVGIEPVRMLLKLLCIHQRREDVNRKSSEWLLTEVYIPFYSIRFYQISNVFVIT